MRTRFRLLRLCFVLVAGILSSMPVLAGPQISPPQQEGLSTPTPGELNPADIIQAVNFLRLQHGLNPLTVHNVLMEVAASQANALAASGGAVGHQRPCGMTLGQELILKGFPLWGDLSLDGYRSENWGTAMTADETISMWLVDDLHANTMLSPNRSDIGAAVAVSDQIYVVLETALRTNSGEHQGMAYDILTGIPMTQAACRGWATQNAELDPFAQYSVPVALSTARPDGDVIHEVMYGQTLWSIAIQYGTTIEQIKRLNNLTDNIVVQGWKLLVQKDATQPAPITVSPPATESATYQISTPTQRNTITPTQDTNATSFQMNAFVRQNSTVVAALLISFSVMVAGIMGFGRKKGS